MVIIMYQQTEIEFKSFLSEEKYLEMLKKLNLKDKIFEQTNYYFDNDNRDISSNKAVLRIRKKDQYKLTTKVKDNDGNNLETHKYLTDKQALDMLENGFDASIINMPYFVKLKGYLTTYRAKCPYLNGTIFLDKNEYNGHLDYELEYETTTSKEDGEIEFKDILKEFNIEYKPSMPKTKRCLNTIK